MTEEKTGRIDLLWLFLFLVVFINGFEAGGYQASLYSIGQTYDLSVTKMGIFASVELLATMLAPLILGNWADKSDKIKCILILQVIQAIFSGAIFLSFSRMVFVMGIFFLGMTTSALQFIAIAALAEAYPLTGKKKIGIMTSMYALGALVSPLFVDFYLKSGISWRMLFLTLSLGTVITSTGITLSRDSAGEVNNLTDEDKTEGSNFVVLGILLLCVVMCIYVGFENGFAFFVDTLFTDVLKSSLGKYALSLFWAVMIPSRVLVGYFSAHARKILISSVIAIPVITVIIAQMNNSIVVLALCIPLGFACGAIYPSVLNTLLQFAGNRKATATAMITVSTGIGGVIFTALTGILAGALGIKNAIMCLAAFFILSLAAVLSLNLKFLKK